MSYDAKVLEVMIASPADVLDEREAVRGTLAEWNSAYSRDRRTVLLPVSWDTHSGADLGGRPQQLINDRVLSRADVLVGIFWTRIGSPTGKAISGSVEEIEAHHQQGKPVMLYFSNRPAPPHGLDHAQLDEVAKFRKWAEARGLISAFDSLADFREKFRHHLALNLNDNSYLKAQRPAPPAAASQRAGTWGRPVTLSNEEVELLGAAADDDQASIQVLKTMAGAMVGTGKRQFCEAGNNRESARWEGAVQSLVRHGLVKDVSGGRGVVFQLTDAGYKAVGR
jgi:hypothetical protein